MLKCRACQTEYADAEISITRICPDAFCGGTCDPIPMTPEDARRIATSNLHGPVIEPLLKHVHKRIAEAANKGRFEITHPLQDLPTGVCKWPSVEEQEALWLALQKEGWKVTHHPDPDPGHPASGPYTTVSW